MISPLVVLLSLAITGAPDAGTTSADAFATWARDDDFDTFDDVGLSGFNLKPGQRVDERSLAEATRVQPLLDRALARVREGLSAPSCRWAFEGAGIQPLRFAKDVQIRAVLGASRGEPVDEMARDILTMGRRLARCEGTPLISFATGSGIERIGIELIAWGASVGVWDEKTMGELKQALSTAPLGVADLEAALRNEEAFSAGLLPEQTPDRAVYDRTGSVELLGAAMERIIAMTRSPKPNVDALMKSFDKMIAASEAKRLAGLDASSGKIRLEKIAALRRPPGSKKNVVGRYLVTAMALRIAKVADRLRKELEADTRALPTLPRAAPRADPSTWIIRVPEAGKSALE